MMKKEDQVPGQVRDVGQDLADPWREIQRELAASVHEDTYRLWFSPLSPASRRGATLYLTGPRRVIRWVGRRYMELLRASAHRAVEGIREVELVSPEDAAAGCPASGEAASRVALNPDYTFDRFVIGPGNRLAHAAALAIAEAPGEAYNPLFLHGPPGLGKTHLLGAIANYLHRHSPQLAVHYTTAESFTNEFVSSLHGAGIDGFKERYRRADVLLIDDVQFLQGKARTADEFFHTFNALYEGGAQLVLTADRVPAELSALAERLRDRFEWGLTVPVEPPDLATRLVFLGSLAREHSEQLPPDALRALASKASSNLRVLKGALTRVVALSSLTASAVTPDSVDRALRPRRSSHLHPRPRRPPRSRRPSPPSSASASTPSSPRPEPRPSPGPGSSPCTSPASSPTSRYPRSPRPSTAATTPPSCTRSVRSSAKLCRTPASPAPSKSSAWSSVPPPQWIVTEPIERIDRGGCPHIHAIHNPYYS